METIKPREYGGFVCLFLFVCFNLLVKVFLAKTKPFLIAKSA